MLKRLVSELSLGNIVGKIDSGVGKANKLLGGQAIYDAVAGANKVGFQSSINSWLDAEDVVNTFTKSNYKKAVSGNSLPKSISSFDKYQQLGKYEQSKARLARQGAIYGIGAYAGYTALDNQFNVGGTASSLFNRILP